jgi:hypothetical protein
MLWLGARPGIQWVSLKAMNEDYTTINQEIYIEEF